jgi:hypothetical protein
LKFLSLCIENLQSSLETWHFIKEADSPVALEK